MSTTAPPDQPQPDETAPRRRRRLLPTILIAVAAVLVLAIAGVAVYGYTLDKRVSANITRGIDLPTETPSGTESAPAPARATGELNYVLLGSDSRDTSDAADGRSDSIMVVHLNAKRTKAYIISFPRDMYVSIPGHGKNKINAAFSEGGPTLTVRTLEDLTGTRMDHVVLVDFTGFIKLTDDLGGVTVPNKTAFSSHGYDYPVGKVKIKGAKALWFVRERHALPGGDLTRAANQRNVIKAIVAKGLSPAVISNPVKFTTFVGNLSKNLTVDNSLSDADIRSTALSLRLNASGIKLLQAPLSNFAMIGGQSVDVVDTTKMAELGKALKDDDLAAYLKNNPQEK